MDANELHRKLTHAATAYDAKQYTRKGYNRYALGHYLEAIGDAEHDIADGKTVRDALLSHFCGRLLDVMLRAAGESKSTAQEIRAYDARYFQDIFGR